MWFGVLGPLDVRHDGTSIPVSAAKQRVLLAALLLHANHVVSFDDLAGALWDCAPPAEARSTVRNYAMRLRRALGPEAAARVVTRDPGYVIEVAEEELDMLRFRALCRAGGAAVRSCDWPRAHGALSEALGLWRGPALADVASQVLQREEVPRLEQMRLQALEERIEADLHLARHGELAAELHSVTTQHPLRERFHAQLMLALYRGGRQAEALAAYRRARDLLIEELGVEPGPELRLLHERILNGDPGLGLSGPAAPGADPPHPMMPSPMAPQPVAAPHNPRSQRPPDADQLSGGDPPSEVDPPAGEDPPASTGTLAGHGALTGATARWLRSVRHHRVRTAVGLVAGLAAVVAVLVAWTSRSAPRAGTGPGASPAVSAPARSSAASPGAPLYAALIAADCPHLPGTSALVYNPVPPLWSTGTVGGFSGGGCYGEFFYQSQSGTTALSPNYGEWTDRVIPAVATRCDISIYIANSPHSAGIARYSVSTLAHGLPHVIGHRAVDQGRHHGDWISAGPYQVMGRWLRVDVHAQDPQRRDITVSAINVYCPGG